MRSRGIRFVVVGLGAAFVHLAVVKILLTLNTVGPLIANTIGFGTAVNISFLGHYHWTFRAKGAYRITFFKFLLSSMILYASNTIVLAIFLQLAIFSSFGSILCANLAIPLVSFLLAKFWIFRE